MLKHPDEVYPLIKLKMEARKVMRKQIPPQPHWGFCFTILPKVSISTTLAIQKLPKQLRGPVCIFYLVLRALDTVEDDTSIATEVKVPILLDFHRHIYDRKWHFSCDCTKKYYKVLMDNFHHVSTAFLELEKPYQEIIEDITKRMGRGMAKFIGKEVETIDDFDEYCHYAAGLVGIGLSRLFHTAWKEDLTSDSLSNSMGLFLQRTNVIRDYLEDINETPKCRMFWPRQIWSKYVDKLEELKYEENSVKAVECLNEMMMSMGTLAMCYNNIQVFRGVVQIRLGLTAKIIDQAKTMEDVYKVDINDPNASKTLERLEIIMKTCRESGALNNRKSYILSSQPNYTRSDLIAVLFIIIVAIIFLGYPSEN
nr:squalene synthase-like [Ipomoea trifida]